MLSLPTTTTTTTTTPATTTNQCHEIVEGYESTYSKENQSTINSTAEGQFGLP